MKAKTRPTNRTQSLSCKSSAMVRPSISRNGFGSTGPLSSSRQAAAERRCALLNSTKADSMKTTIENKASGIEAPRREELKEAA